MSWELLSAHERWLWCQRLKFSTLSRRLRCKIGKTLRVRMAASWKKLSKLLKRKLHVIASTVPIRTNKLNLINYSIHNSVASFGNKILFQLKRLFLLFTFSLRLFDVSIHNQALIGPVSTVQTSFWHMDFSEINRYYSNFKLVQNLKKKLRGLRMLIDVGVFFAPARGKQNCDAKFHFVP